MNAQHSDHYIITIFKHNYEARTFKVTSCFLRTLSWILIIMISLLLIFLSSSIGYYLQLKKAPSSQYTEYLQSEILDLQKKLKQAQTPFATEKRPLLFPSHIRPVFPSNIPITLTEPKWIFFKDSVLVKLAIEYTQSEGSQQGKFFFLAQTEGFLTTFPKEVLKSFFLEHLLYPEFGENFSVSRYRELKAEFKFFGEKRIDNINLYIFTKELEPLLFKSWKVPYASSNN